jgi:LuxR family quorum-sensing system transcriptional regulator CciR
VSLLELIGDFYETIDLLESPEQLSAHLETICGLAGLRYFAITHHVDFGHDTNAGIHVHNYPRHFADFHDTSGLGARDPVHRASQLRVAGFHWEALSTIVALTAEDVAVLERAERAGIGPGYTVPVHIPGEFSGSSSFAVSRGLAFPRTAVPVVEALGGFAFEAARRLQTSPPRSRRPIARLTDREREIVVCLGQGKPEKQIARILGISPWTVNDHLKHARARCGVQKSALLVVVGLLSGSITYAEIIEPRHPVPTG